MNFALILTCTSLTLNLQEPRLTTTQAEPPEDVSPAIAATLRPAKYSVTLSENQLDFWFAKSLVGQANATQIANGLSYRELTEGQLVGIVSIQQEFIDFRKQQIPAGLYSLRLAFQPDLGDHKGTSPYPDFLLLCPIDADRDSEPISGEELRKLSSKITEGDHPAVMLLVPQKIVKQPELLPKKNNLRCLAIAKPVVLPSEDVNIGIGIVVEGVSDAR